MLLSELLQKPILSLYEGEILGNVNKVLSKIVFSIISQRPRKIGIPIIKVIIVLNIEVFREIQKGEK